AAVRGARGDRGIGRTAEPEVARHPDLAELLREALDPAAREGEVAVDPDEWAGRDLLAVEKRVGNDEELLVLRARRVGQLGAAVLARLPVGEHRGAAAGVGVRVHALGQDRADGVGVGPVVDDEERADVVPRRRRDERRRAGRRAGDAVAAQRHGWTGSGSGSPRISPLSRSDATAAASKRKYERGGSGPQGVEEERASGPPPRP